MTKVPPELTDRIIDFLHSDRKALKTCALVCKSWIPSSRLHLFETLYLTTSNKILELTNLLGSNDSTTIERHVRTLKINDWVPFVRLAQYLSRFPALESLILIGVQDDIHGLDDLHLWFNGITNLDVMSFQFINPKCFSRFLDAFPLLESLRINLRGLSRDDDAQSPTISLPLRIRILHIILSSSMLPFLLSIRFPPLAELSLYEATTSDLVGLYFWFRSLPSTLRALNIRFSAYSSKQAVLSRMEQ
jgi:hypothetical protein